MNLPAVTQKVQDASKLVRVAAVAGVVAVLAILAPVLWAAVSAGIGALALIVIGLVGAGLIQSIGFLSQKWENMILKARKNEARKNPLEQLDNFFKDKRVQVTQFKAAVSQVGSQVMSLEEMVRERKKTKPGYDASKQEETIRAMKAAHGKLVVKYQNAELALTQLQDKIEEEKFNWKFAQAGQQALTSLNASSGEDVMESILAGEAFSSIKDNFHQVFAELETEAINLSSSKQISFENGMYLDVSNIDLPAFSKV